MSKVWGALKPGNVSDWINFDKDNSSWTYEGDTQQQSMSSRQAEGVAYLWNLLSINNIALLADEVGMGKTFQALGVASMLWKVKPNAKILVMAPNWDICAHWQREFKSFVKTHYRKADHKVKNSVDGRPIPLVRISRKLSDLLSVVKERPGHLYLTTINALSGLVPVEEKGSDNIRIAKRNARKIKNEIQKVLEDDCFDLLIVDEAQYFRNVSGGSQRVNAAREFFGGEGEAIAGKVLLLTATPNHKHQTDIGNILSYFLSQDVLEGLEPQYLMEKYALRRFRRMQGKDSFHSKHEYRNEKALACDFSERPESEMFFALYQKKLVTELGLVKNNKSLLYGFLEGFESPGRRSLDSEIDNPKDPDNDEARNSYDYHKADDTSLLIGLCDQFYNEYSRLPDHPKYGQIVDLAVPKDLFLAPRDLHEDKHLIFVRRIPSVRELTQRVNHAYDEILAKKIYESWGLSENDPVVSTWRKTSWSRAGFLELIEKLKRTSKDDSEYLEDEVMLEEKGDIDFKLDSAISNLFVTKKGQGLQTDCSNVSLRFRKPESLFAMFLEPSIDYMEKGYVEYYESGGHDKKRSYYTTAALDKRKFTHALESVNSIYDLSEFDKEIKTVWSLVFPFLSQEQQSKLECWSVSSPEVAENFSNYIKTGFVFSSPVMVEIYAWFTEFNRAVNIANAQEKYFKFYDFVSVRIKKSLLLSYFKNALDTFEVLCEKIIDHGVGDWRKPWRTFSLIQSPARYASGEVGNRQSLILGFNSPFYPNVLISTSVFQEGVNLHLQCRKVYHYGIAGSAGDNEQRIGRVDRLFGKVNEKLKVDGLAELEINYPFLKGSVDEDQVAAFVASKFHIEQKMDSCTHHHSSKHIELTRDNWKNYLRRPKSITIQDPYVAKFDKGCMPEFPYPNTDKDKVFNIQSLIKPLLLKISEEYGDKLHVVEKNQHNSNAIFLIDPTLDEISDRKWQPILIEKHFSSEFSALVKGTVYYISLVSPISSRENLTEDRFGLIEPCLKNIESSYPLVRVAIDEKYTNSYFYLHARVDLPVFIEGSNMLSFDEVDCAYKQLKFSADFIENELFSGQQDLPAEKLKIYQHTSPAQRESLERFNMINGATEAAKWTLVKGDKCATEHLTETISSNNFDRMLSGKIKLKNIQSRYMRVLHANSCYPFIRFSEGVEGQYVLNIGYPYGDIQFEERGLLQQWFNYINRIIILN